MRQGHLQERATASNIELDINTTIQDLEQEGTYEYLRVSEGERNLSLSDEREDLARALPQHLDGIKV